MDNIFQEEHEPAYQTFSSDPQPHHWQLGLSHHVSKECENISWQKQKGAKFLLKREYLIKLSKGLKADLDMISVIIVIFNLFLYHFSSEGNYIHPTKPTTILNTIFGIQRQKR